MDGWVIMRERTWKDKKWQVEIEIEISSRISGLTIANTSMKGQMSVVVVNKDPSRSTAVSGALCLANRFEWGPKSKQEAIMCEKGVWVSRFM